MSAMKHEEAKAEIEEALRCLTLIGHVARSSNTWASRAIAAVPHIQKARSLLTEEAT